MADTGALAIAALIAETLLDVLLLCEPRDRLRVRALNVLGTMTLIGRREGTLEVGDVEE